MKKVLFLAALLFAYALAQDPLINNLRGFGNIVFSGTKNRGKGNDNTFKGSRNYVNGNKNNFEGDYNAVDGDENDIEGDQNDVNGVGNRVSGGQNFVVGDGNIIMGEGNQVNSGLSPEEQEKMMQAMMDKIKERIQKNFFA